MVDGESKLRRWGGHGRGGGVGDGIEVSAFFACATLCALRPCTRWVERTVGVGVLSAPAGFRTSYPRLGFQLGTRNAQDPLKPTGWYVRGRQIRLSAPLLPLLPFTLFFCFLFPPLALLRHTGIIVYSFHRLRTCTVRTFSLQVHTDTYTSLHRISSQRDEGTCFDILWNKPYSSVLSRPTSSLKDS